MRTVIPGPGHMSEASEWCPFGCYLGSAVQTWTPSPTLSRTTSARLKLVEDALVRDRHGVPSGRFLETPFFKIELTTMVSRCGGFMEVTPSTINCPKASPRF
eukprot:gene7077-biopygen12007